MMAGIRGKDTKPELTIRKGLFRKGLRYRTHVSALPGRPDLVFPRYGAAVFVHGCFWHGHGCVLFRWPSSNTLFWRQKITRNQVVDLRSRESLLSTNWRVMTVWECSLKGPNRRPTDEVIAAVRTWLVGTASTGEITGLQRDESP